MSRRTGDSYTGARWAFSPGPRKMRRSTGGEGVSVMGGSSRRTETHRRQTCPTCDGWQQVEGRVGGLVDCPTCTPDDAAAPETEAS